MARNVVAGNWKMNKNMAEAVSLAQAVGAGLDDAGGVEVILCPPFVSLTAVKDAVGDGPVKVGAQNMHFEESGAFTGEVSALMLQGICDYVVLGHSERRQLFGETDDLVNSKVKSAFQHGLRPILCIGETLAQREAGQAASVVEQQLRTGLDSVEAIAGLVVAYEPIWAIGTGQSATPEIAAEIMGGPVQHTLRSMFGASADDVPLLYGGSVNPGNVASFAAQTPIHGALVGGASLQADQFLEIINQTAAAKA